MEVLDERGIPLEIVTCNTLCPSAWVEQARNIAEWHMRNIENATDDTSSRMLTVPLGPFGAVDPTHFLCVRKVFWQQVDLERETLRQKHEDGLEWCSGEIFSPWSAPHRIKNSFCCIVGETAALLANLELWEI